LPRADFEGNASTLLADVRELAFAADHDISKRSGFPQNPRAMRAALDRIRPNLRADGIEVVAPKGDKNHKNRTIVIRSAPLYSDLDQWLTAPESPRLGH